MFPIGNIMVRSVTHPPNLPDRESRLTAVRDLGVSIRATRKRCGLDQRDAAGLAGVGLRFLSDLENGKPTVRLDKVMRVLDALGLELVVRAREHRYD